MKTKNIKFFITAIAIIITVVSCSKDFLQVSPKGTSLEANYYKDQTEALAGLVAVYDVMRKNSGGFENMITMMNAGSDDHYAGGGGASDGAGIQSFSNYTIDANTIPRSFWSDHYQGIFRANFLLTKLPDVPMDEALKTRYTAEVKALRANYYFNLVRMFKNIPLITAPLSSSEFNTVVQATSADVYAQIENDLTEAIANLPATVTAAEAGRFSKGAARALLGKVYLYENKNTLAAAEFEAVNGTPGGTSQFGYKLLDNYNNLWVVTNKFNTESILEVAHTNASSTGWGNWGSGSDEGNSTNVMCGPRSYKRNSDPAPDLPSGWSFNVITEDYYDFIKTDPRFGATVLDMKALKAGGFADYIGGYQDTGYFLNKFTPRKSDVTTGTGEPVLNYKQNSYVIRLADTYLMEAEALGGTGARAQALLNAVRDRAYGDTAHRVTVSLATIADERRLELGGEGHRFFDLVRTAKASSVLGNRGFTAGKNEIFPIPFKELENTQLVQNPNYN